MGYFRELFFGEAERPEPAAAPVSPATGEEPQIVHVQGFSNPAAKLAGYGALMSVDYAACEQTKARSMSSLPVDVIRRVGDNRETVHDHPLARLFNGMANDEMTGADLRNWMRLRCDTFGNAYMRVEWWRDEIVAIWPILGGVRQRFDMDRPEGRRTAYDVVGDKYTERGRYFSDEIVNVKTHITKNGTKGLSLARLACEEIGLSVDLERFYQSMLRNGNHHMGHVELPEKNIQPAAKDDLRKAIDAKAGIGSAGKTPIFAYGAKWVNDNQTMKDASVIEQQEWVLQQVCRACNVPPWKVYYNNGSTYSGSQQQNIDYVVETILPDARALEMAFAPVFAARNEFDCSLKLDVRGLMRGDDSARSAYYREMLYGGVYSRAEIRKMEDLNPIAGLEKPLFPLNYGTVEEDGSVTVYSSDTTEPADGNQAGMTD
ncbi:MAG: phage portal protein [Eggerthellaceae bacterium]|nr:phage portal protein [Eggerthellaceae bacterium]